MEKKNTPNSENYIDNSYSIELNEKSRIYGSVKFQPNIL